MLKRSVLTLATVISLIGISEAFGEEKLCFWPAKDMPGNSQALGERPKIVVRTNQDCRMADTATGRVFKIQLLHPPRPCPDHPKWIWVTTIQDTTGRTDVVTGWIPKDWLGAEPPLKCARAFR
jgi:hypothetical protein